MATTQDYIEFVCERIEPRWPVRYRKMFGEYMVYVNEKPLLLVCDNTVYVKIVSELDTLLADAERGAPYNGAKPHYIVDVENRELLNSVISILEKIIPIPMKKTRKQVPPSSC